MIDKKFIEGLKPAELELVSSYICDLVKKKVTPDTSNHENMEVKSCPRCGSLHFVKNGHDPKRRQKYMCKDCKTSFRSVSDALFYRSKISYHDWTSFIAAELNGLTINHLDEFMGPCNLRIGDELILKKDKDNYYDDEAIAAYTKDNYKCGYVANSVHSVARGTYSAGRVYDQIKDEARCAVRFILAEEGCLIAEIKE